jgi:hypothetical protein
LTEPEPRADKPYQRIGELIRISQYKVIRSPAKSQICAQIRALGGWH